MLLLRATLCMHQGRVKPAMADVVRVLQLVDAMDGETRSSAEMLAVVVNARIKLGSMWMQVRVGEKRQIYIYEMIFENVRKNRSNAGLFRKKKHGRS